MAHVSHEGRLCDETVWIIEIDLKISQIDPDQVIVSKSYYFLLVVDTHARQVEMINC